MTQNSTAEQSLGTSNLFYVRGTTHSFMQRTLCQNWLLWQCHLTCITLRQNFCSRVKIFKLRTTATHGSVAGLITLRSPYANDCANVTQRAWCNSLTSPEEDFLHSIWLRNSSAFPSLKLPTCTEDSKPPHVLVEVTGTQVVSFRTESAILTPASGDILAAKR